MTAAARSFLSLQNKTRGRSETPAPVELSILMI